MRKKLTKIEHFFELHGIVPQEILYIVRENGKSAIYLFNGRVVRTYNTIKSLFDELPKGAFLNINKGVVVAVTQVEEINGGKYIMKDGRTFSGRVRNGVQHKKNQSLLEMRLDPMFRVDPRDLRQWFSLYEELPRPFFVVETRFNKRSHAVEFSLRYANKEAEKLCQKNLDELLAMPFEKVFQEDSHRLTSICSEVAISHSQRLLKDYSFAKGKRVTFECFCPSSGYCGLLGPTVLKEVKSKKKTETVQDETSDD